jgi:hypothetical protein
MSMAIHGEMLLPGQTRRTWRKTCLGATLYNTDHTRTDPGANPGLRSEKPATNRLSSAGYADVSKTSK